MAFTEKYVRGDAAGGGSGDANNSTDAYTLAEAITHSATATGIRYNIALAGGTIANTTTNRTFAGVALTTAPNWWRGFNTTIGDCDGDPTLTKPSITFTTGRFLVTAVHQWFSSLNISGAHVTAGGGQIQVSANGCRFFRVRSECTAANANSRAFISSVTVALVECWFKATTTATDAVGITGGGYLIEGCTITGGISGIGVTTGSGTIRKCGIFSPAGDGIRFTSTAPTTLLVANCSFYECVSDGIDFAVLTATGCYVITDCVFKDSGAFDINNSTGANTNFVLRANNTSFSPGTAHENGFGDSPNFDNNTDSSSPFTSATDLTLVSGSNALASALPGLFENQTFTSYADAGAVQSQSSGAASMMRPVPQSGGLV